jgi:putative membrane-bound dehydrogenase-like protein
MTQTAYRRPAIKTGYQGPLESIPLPRNLTVLLVIFCVIATAIPQSTGASENSGKSAQESLRLIQVAPGFTVELVASEPLVKDPIAFDWGADGKFWVVEMGDYPLGVDGKGKPGGLIRYLEDTNGDGRYDKQTTFLDGLSFPTGVMPWRAGVFIACAPDIFYAEDRDGDGKADYREILFTGFGQGNQQHRLNGFDMGLDGWIYGANGDSDGVVHLLNSRQTTRISGRDFRFQPETAAFEAESGRTQFGRHRDDWGHWFGNNNPNWGWHYVLADRDLRRNTSYAPPDPRQTLEPDTRLYPISRTAPRYNDPGAANHVTSANSITPYRDELFGPEFATTVFVSEPVHNLIHRMVLEPQGMTFRGRRTPDESQTEFLASSDTWFRPTMLRTGPDGALWIADMYRAVIEHPQWIPDDWEKQLDLRGGSEQGRIYRVFPRNAKPRPIPRLDKFDTAKLVAALDSPSGWQRDTAQRLLLHRRDLTATALLRTLAIATKRPKTRVQSIWTLAALRQLDEPSAMAGLDDPDGRVTAAVIGAIGPVARTSRLVADALIRLADHADPHVRLQATLALGFCEDSRASHALASLARRDGNDSWMRAAILSAAPPHADRLLLDLLRDNPVARQNSATVAILEPLLRMSVSRKDRLPIDQLVRAIAVPAEQGGRYAPWQFTALALLLDARDKSDQLNQDLDKPFAWVWSAARRVVADEKETAAGRSGAIRLVAYGARQNTKDRDLLVRLLRPRVAIELQQAVIAALATTADPKLADVLLVDWNKYSPSIKTAIFDAMLSRTVWSSSLLSSLEDGCVPPAEIDLARRQALITRRGNPLRARAEAIFAHQSQPRQNVVDAYRSALTTRGEKAAGAAIFKQLCTSCHRLNNDGVDVGPDFNSMTDRSPEALLIAILDPNRAFEAKFANFSVATSDGRVLTGMVAHESATAVTLRGQDGKEEIILRSQIDEMTASGQSLMPEGFEKKLQPRDLADLIAFLAPLSASPEPKPRNN